MYYMLMVITGPDEDINYVMEPFDESLSVDSYIESTKEELIEEARNIQKQLIEGIKEDPDYEPSEYEQGFLNATNDEELYRSIRDDFFFTYDKDGNKTSTCNPNARWSSWNVGGRWENFLRLKSGSRADAAAIKDIVFADDDKRYYEALKWWNSCIENRNDEIAQMYKKATTSSKFAKVRSKFGANCAIVDGEWIDIDDMEFSPEREKDWYENFYARYIANRDKEDVITILECCI